MSWSASIETTDRRTALDLLRERLTSSKNQGEVHDRVLDAVVSSAEVMSAGVRDDQKINISTYGHIGSDGTGNASVTINIANPVASPA
jgi:hypothetical protein